jgi:hypothetical protein
MRPDYLIEDLGEHEFDDDNGGNIFRIVAACMVVWVMIFFIIFWSLS